MAKRKPITWIIILSSKKAKIQVNEGPGTGLTLLLIEEVMKRLALDAARASKKKSSGGWWPFGGGSKPKKPKIRTASSAKEMMSDLISVLNRAGRRGYYDTLVLVGPKPLTEKIKDNLKGAAEESLHGELTKDLINASEYELQKFMGHIIRL